MLSLSCLLLWPEPLIGLSRRLSLSHVFDYEVEDEIGEHFAKLFERNLMYVKRNGPSLCK